MAITKKQLAMLLFMITTAGKFLMLPSVYAEHANQDVWIAGLANFITDGLLLAVVLLFIKKFKGQTFYGVLEDSVGKTAANILFLIYALYFALKAAEPIFEQRNYIEITLYETTPSVLTFLPFFAVAFYVLLKGVKVTGRAAEILFWLCAAGFGLALGLSLPSIDLYNLRPVFKNPLNLTLKASYNGLQWFGQPLLILFLAGKIKTENHFFRWMIISFAAAAILSELIFVCFTGIYGDLAPRETYALPKMTKYGIALTNTIRFDYIATLFLLASSVITLSVPLIVSAECLCTVFGENKRVIFSAVLAAAELAAAVTLRLQFKSLIAFFETYLTPIMCVLAYLLPIIALFSKRRSNEKILEK